MKFIGLLFFCFLVPFVLFGCSDQTGPGTKPYLNIYGAYPIFRVDTTDTRWVTDSTVLIQLSDGSSFRLVPGMSAGYSNCFYWTVDDTLEATFHHVTLHVNMDAVKRLTPSTNFAEADYYPMVLTSTDFLASQSITALAFVDTSK